MANDDDRPKDEVGLALSGGGFRAALFHLGTLWRLNEFGILAGLGRVSSVSGGAITAGVLATRWSSLGLVQGRVARLIEEVVEPVRAFCRLSLDAAAVGEGLLLPWRSATDAVERAYADHLFGARTLRDLPADPAFVFNSTNLQTGRSFRFTKRYIGDYTIGLVDDAPVPLARVVAASSAFPPFLSPVVLEAPGPFRAVEGSIHHGDPAFTRRLHLTDGGAYDNLGLETVWNRCRTVLVSDAGAPFATTSEVETDWVRQTLRALDIATDQSRGLRKRALVDQFERGDRDGTYWGIDSAIAGYGLDDALTCDPGLVAALARIRTRLDHTDDETQERLINWGYALCDAAVRRHAPQLARPDAPRPDWPYPQRKLGSAPS
ncbi:MAG: patatin-like phospholipase family protein [Methylobacterium frigidaeris]